MRRFLSRARQDWLDRRLPPLSPQRLTQRHVFLLPSRQGAFYLLVAGLLFLAGINYQNNLILGLSFLMGSVFLVAILHTWRNLSGLVLAADRQQPAHADQTGRAGWHLQPAPGRGHYGLTLRRGRTPLQQLSVLPGQSARLWLPVPLSRRGWNAVGRLTLESGYPLGLIRAWTHLDLGQRVLAWPRPQPCEHCPARGASREPGPQAAVTEGTEQFRGHGRWQERDGLTRLDWKAYARGQGWHRKMFEEPAQGRLWLDWEQMPGLDAETRLSRLAWWALQLERQGQRFGLILPDLTLAPARGPEHLRQVLDALGEYGEVRP